MKRPDVCVICDVPYVSTRNRMDWRILVFQKGQNREAIFLGFNKIIRLIFCTSLLHNVGELTDGWSVAVAGALAVGDCVGDS